MPCTIEVETSARPGGAYSGAALESTMVFAIGERVGVEQQAWPRPPGRPAPTW